MSCSGGRGRALWGALRASGSCAMWEDLKHTRHPELGVWWPLSGFCSGSAAGFSYVLSCPDDRTAEGPLEPPAGLCTGAQCMRGAARCRVTGLPGPLRGARARLQRCAHQTPILPSLHWPPSPLHREDRSAGVAEVAGLQGSKSRKPIKASMTGKSHPDGGQRQIYSKSAGTQEQDAGASRRSFGDRSSESLLPIPLSAPTRGKASGSSCCQ